MNRYIITNTVRSEIIMNLNELDLKIIERAYRHFSAGVERDSLIQYSTEVRILITSLESMPIFGDTTDDV